MHEQATKDSAFDHEALCSALRAVGIFYGSKGLPASAQGLDEAGAIRAYIRSERPQLLASYDMESLVALVKAAKDAGGTSSLEQYAPA